MTRLIAFSLLAIATYPAPGAAQVRSDSARADSALRLRPITVTRAPAVPDRSPFSVATVDAREESRGRPTLGLDEVLVSVPGVIVTNRFNYAQDQSITIRGSGARSVFGIRGVRVLLDGIPQTLPDGQGQLNNVELAEAARIEVLRGSASSLHGNASGGVVSIWTDAGLVRRLSPDLTVIGGADGLFKWQAGLSAPIASGAASLTASRTVIDGYRDSSHADIRRLSARVQQAVGGHSVLSVAFHGADIPFVQDPGQLTRAEVDSAPRAASPRNAAVGAGKDVSQYQGGLSFRHRRDNGAGFDAALFGLRRDLQNPIVPTIISLDRWAYGARVAGSVPLPNTGLVVTAGVDAQRQRDDRRNVDRATGRDTLSQLERVTEIGPFLQGMRDLGPATITVGARYDRVSFGATDRKLDDGDQSGTRVMAAASYNAGLAIRASAMFAPYANVATSFETPTTTELTNRPDGLGGFNTDLDPQRATTVELGFRGALGERLRYAVSGYQASVRDALIPFEVPSQPQRRFFQNAGSSRFKGIEAGATLDVARVLQLVAAYTFTHARFRTFRTATDTLDGNTIPGIPKHYLHASARFRGPAGIWGAIDQTVAAAVFVNDVNAEANPSWAVTGLRAGWDLSSVRWGVSPFVGVSNLFNKAYVGSVLINAGFNRYYEPAAGRSVYVGLRAGT